MAKHEKKHDAEEFHLLVVEDDELVARMLQRRLESFTRPTITASAAEATARMRDHDWVAAIVDVGLPEGVIAGLDVLEHLRRELPELPLLTFTARFGAERETTEAIALRSTRAGALVLPKEGSIEELLAFVRRAVRQRMSLEDYLIQAHGLTTREASIVAWVAAEGTLQAFAEREGIALTTVRTHARRIVQRTGFSDLRALVIAAQEARLADRSRKS